MNRSQLDKNQAENTAEITQLYSGRQDALVTWGWGEPFASSLAELDDDTLQPARVLLRNHEHMTVMTHEGIRNAVLSGRCRMAAERGGTMPAVGDWTAVRMTSGEGAVVHSVLPRRSAFSRTQALSGGRKVHHGIVIGGATMEQVLAANIDEIYIVSGLDGNFNVNRIERYWTITRASGAMPVLVLNKADLCADPAPFLERIRRVAPDADPLLLSGTTGSGMEMLRSRLRPGLTVAFLGSSGVGKSTLINALFGEERLRTGVTSGSNGKGRHTTTTAELFLHDSGSLLIDTPGLRELRLWCDEDAVDDSFADVIALTSRCRFSDCAHRMEPGCAVRAAIESGELEAERFENWRGMTGEAQRLASRKKQKELYMAKVNRRGRMEAHPDA